MDYYSLGLFFMSGDSRLIETLERIDTTLTEFVAIEAARVEREKHQEQHNMKTDERLEKVEQDVQEIKLARATESTSRDWLQNNWWKLAAALAIPLFSILGLLLKYVI